ncbi:MAG: hypothetical protein AAGC55_22120, partial [Myxococcota bacterium]
MTARALVGAAALLLLCASIAHGGGRDIGLVWRSQAVQHPVALTDLTPRPPYIRTAGAPRRDPVTVDAQRAAALWLGPTELVRVRVLDADGAPGAGSADATERLSATSVRPRFGRITGGAHGRMVISEPGVALDEHSWYLIQPPGGGNLWFITADAPLRIAVDRPSAREGRLVWELVRSQILSWIDRDGIMPDLPAVAGSTAVELRLRLDEAVARIVDRTFASSPALDRALRAWRKTSALIALDSISPAIGKPQARRRIDRSLGPNQVLRLGRAGPASPGADYRRIDRDQLSHEFTADGPGILRIEIR